MTLTNWWRPSVRGDLEWGTTPNLLRDAAKRYTGREAIADGGTRLTYSDLAIEADDAAAAFIAAGVEAGDGSPSGRPTPGNGWSRSLACTPPARCWSLSTPATREPKRADRVNHRARRQRTGVSTHQPGSCSDRPTGRSSSTTSPQRPAGTILARCQSRRPVVDAATRRSNTLRDSGSTPTTRGLIPEASHSHPTNASYH